MVKREYWIERIETAWKTRNVIWLAGVRRVGKTVLCQSLDGVVYYDCELPRVRSQMEDPQGFLDGLKGRRVVLDEIHRLSNPSELLKIAADHYPDIHVIATGSSSLGASSKFGDTLTGRKTDIWLTPLACCDLENFGNPDLSHRMLHGGLPPFFMAGAPPEAGFQEWMDAYWAKDIQELFRLERKSSFQKFVELILLHSGGIFEATGYASPCEVSRTTITNYLSVLSETYVAHIIKPFNTHRPAEIVSAPKVYAFDTGFVCAFRGWNTLREEDCGVLWEHLVLNEFQAHFARAPVNYWRDKRGHEVDFILPGRGWRMPAAIECKWKAGRFDPCGLAAFRRSYAEGPNYVVAHDVESPYKRTLNGLEVTFHSISSLMKTLAGHPCLEENL
jgi:predicted AAA+ superfamily ATPase